MTPANATPVSAGHAAFCPVGPIIPVYWLLVFCTEGLLRWLNHLYFWRDCLIFNILKNPTFVPTNFSILLGRSFNLTMPTWRSVLRSLCSNWQMIVTAIVLRVVSSPMVSTAQEFMTLRSTKRFSVIYVSSRTSAGLIVESIFGFVADDLNSIGTFE